MTTLAVVTVEIEKAPQIIAGLVKEGVKFHAYQEAAEYLTINITGY